MLSKHISIVYLILLNLGCGTTPIVGVDVPKGLIDYSNGITEYYWSNMISPVQIDDMIEDAGLSIIYLPHDTPILKANQLGVFNGINILLRYYEEDSYHTCMRDRYVLAHELLHFLCETLGTCTYQQSSEHLAPRVFVRWALNNHVPGPLVVEHPLYLSIKHDCINRWGTP